MEGENVTRTTLTMKETVEYLGVSYWLVTQLVKRKQYHKGIANRKSLLSLFHKKHGTIL